MTKSGMSLIWIYIIICPKLIGAVKFQDEGNKGIKVNGINVNDIWVFTKICIKIWDRF